MEGENGGVVDDGAMAWVVNDLHGNELGAERQDVQICPHRLVFLEDLEQQGEGVKRDDENQVQMFALNPHSKHIMQTESKYHHEPRTLRPISQTLELVWF